MADAVDREGESPRQPSPTREPSTMPVELANYLKAGVALVTVVVQLISIRARFAKPSLVDAAIFLVICAIVVLYTELWRRWLFWRRQPKEKTYVVLMTIAALAIFIETFAVVAWVLFDHFGSNSLFVAQNVKTKAMVSPHDLPYWRVELYYLWHFLDAIPALQLPETLNWKLRYTFVDLESGALLMLFKFLIIAPVIAMAVQWIQQRRARTRAEHG